MAVLEMFPTDWIAVFRYYVWIEMFRRTTITEIIRNWIYGLSFFIYDRKHSYM